MTFLGFTGNVGISSATSASAALAELGTYLGAMAGTPFNSDELAAVQANATDDVRRCWWSATQQRFAEQTASPPSQVTSDTWVQVYRLPVPTWVAGRELAARMGAGYVK